MTSATLLSARPMSVDRLPRVSAVAAGPSPRLRLTRRGRAVITAAIAIPLAAAGIGHVVGGGSAVATDAPTGSRYEYVQVSSGESLWELAATIAPDADPRDVVSDILHLNQLSSGDLQPGQQLAVPHEYSD